MNSAIGNRVWYDLNRNGIQDSNENGIANVRVVLTKPDGTKDSVLTDNSGKYLFQNLVAGTYDLQFRTPAGMKATVSNVGADSLDSDIIGELVNGIIINNNTIDSTIDAGFHNLCTGTIRGNVWHDVDGMDDNWVDSAGAYMAPRIPNGLSISLISNATGLVVKTSLISGNGRFVFLGIVPGNYFLALSEIPGIQGQSSPSVRLTNLWRYSGEKNGLTQGSDGIPNGRLNVALSFECITNANFGIKLWTSNWCVCMD